MNQKIEGRPTIGRPPRPELRGPRPESNIQYQQVNTDPAKAQQPIMGTALRAFLRRYKQDLQAYDLDHPYQTIQQMIGAATFLLAEAEKIAERMS
ncbi:MAG: hypothetical protein BA869_01475 [Desulfuromonadales bacterium C00003107]|jgi:hypothetical protein|nr:MAG: hypothetical protein BA869_01475 [Desulfuromonadales bacterium C00003107]